MRRATTAVLLALVALAVTGAPVAAAEWRSEQPVAAGIGVPVPLGKVGDIEFWAPNRGLLITEGNQGMPPGLYAYDGSGWRLYSTVCGGHEGSIAWAGPTEFWTVSDYAAPPEGAEDAERRGELWRRTLCHFKEGRVVASYAEPFGTADTYLPMSAAACAGPSDCWFAGERLSGDPNAGAFHLHWDGSSLRAVPSLTVPEPGLDDPGRTVRDLAFHAGRFYESVEVRASDGEVPGEPDPRQPSFLHLIEPAAPQPFVRLFPQLPLSYGAGVQGSDLAAFRFTVGAGSLWAIAGASEASEAATVTVLRAGPDALAQVPLDPNATFGPGAKVLGAAAEPGAGRIWVSFRSHEENGGERAARLAAIDAGGGVAAALTLPAAGEEIGAKGAAGPIACAAAGQCWMATEKGWLFHLGGPLPQDTEPAMRALITHRPPDDSTPFVPPIGLPVDDSGAEPPLPKVPPASAEKPPRRPRAQKLVVGVRQQLLGRTVLRLSFTLRARAHVRLRARHRKRVVAQTPRLTMGRGRHSLRLRLDPRRWPTSLDFQVHPAARSAGR